MVIGEPEHEAAALREWYRPRRLAYPWRRRPDPYRVLVSEVMLQQTQAVRVVPAFTRFVSAFPSVRALARASRGDVVRMWDGLGYNRRAIALADAARAIVRHHGGRVPAGLDALRSLPGVGPYTAAAVASLAFGRPVPAMDTNVRRVVARHRLGVEPEATNGRSVDRAAAGWLDRADPGGWNQALMDLGRELCRPRPRCGSCPLARRCRFRRLGGQPGAPRRRQAPFAGSFRELRGSVIRELRRRRIASLGHLARSTGAPLSRTAAAVAVLHREGLVETGPSALAGRSGGRVRLPR